MFIWGEERKERNYIRGERQLSQSCFRDCKKMYGQESVTGIPIGKLLPYPHPAFFFFFFPAWEQNSFFFQAGCYHIHGMVNFRLPRKYLGWSKKLQNRMNRNRRSHKRSGSQCEEACRLKPTQLFLGNSSLAKGGKQGHLDSAGRPRKEFRLPKKFTRRLELKTLWWRTCKEMIGFSIHVQSGRPSTTFIHRGTLQDWRWVSLGTFGFALHDSLRTWKDIIFCKWQRSM